MKTSDLQRRAQPRQDRSRETLSRILEASAALLAETGPDGFNTNLLASTAGLSVRAIYRYFPNKWSILLGLAEQMQEFEREQIRAIAIPPGSQDWQGPIAQGVRRYFRAARTQTGYAAMRSAIAASPQLAQMRNRESGASSIALIELLQQAGVRRNKGELAVMAKVILAICGQLIDLSLAVDERQAEIIMAEAVRAVIAYIAAAIAG